MTRRLAVDPPSPAAAPADAAPAQRRRAPAERRAARLARYEEGLALRARGARAPTIAARVGISQRTVRYGLHAGHFPERRRRSERPGQAAPCAAYLQPRWAEGCHNCAALWQELRARGDTGCYRSAATPAATGAWLRSWHRGVGNATALAARSRCGDRLRTPAAGCTDTPRPVCWLLRRPLDDLTADEHAYLTRLYHACPQIAVAAALVEEFSALLRERDVAGRYRWLRGAEVSGIKELPAVARSLWLDRQAVEAAVRLDGSNGPVEGKVHTLKTTKRAQYGRATFDLLRRRVLHAA